MLHSKPRVSVLKAARGIFLLGPAISQPNSLLEVMILLHHPLGHLHCNLTNVKKKPQKSPQTKWTDHHDFAAGPMVIDVFHWTLPPDNCRKKIPARLSLAREIDTFLRENMGKRGKCWVLRGPILVERTCLRDLHVLCCLLRGGGGDFFGGRKGETKEPVIGKMKATPLLGPHAQLFPISHDSCDFLILSHD